MAKVVAATCAACRLSRELNRRKNQRDQNGNDRYTTEIVADQMQMLDSRGGAGMDASFDQSKSSQPSGQQAPAAPAMDPGGFDDDIPF